MKKNIFAMVAAVLLGVSCQESLDDRCERETREFNEKKCPAKIAEGVTIDSLVFEKEKRTLHYFYTFSGKVDDQEVINKANPRKLLVDEVRNSTSIKTYKDNGFNFRYTYWSASTKKKLADVTVTEKDYR